MFLISGPVFLFLRPPSSASKLNQFVCFVKVQHDAGTKGMSFANVGALALDRDPLIPLEFWKWLCVLPCQLPNPAAERFGTMPEVRHADDKPLESVVEKTTG